MSKFIGIDVSKLTLDVAFLTKDQIWKMFQVSNDENGFKKIQYHLHPADTVVMEASGPYYLPLAMYLHEKSVRVCVENPLVIRRYSQMLLQRAKTDKKDAQVIARYAMSQQPKQWNPESGVAMKIKQVHSAMELLQKQEHQTSRQLEAFENSGILSTSLRKELKSVIRSLKKKKDRLELMMNELAESTYSDILSRLQTIPGIGRKTAIFLTVLTDGFRKFTHHKQLIAYVGFSPRIYQSGTSVKGRGHICKMGKPQIRKLLYLCSWTAKSCNQTCKQMYDRLKAKGKPERVIKIAIANKLLKQAFAIGKFNRVYDENYLQKVCF